MPKDYESTALPSARIDGVSIRQAKKSRPSNLACTAFSVSRRGTVGVLQCVFMPMRAVRRRSRASRHSIAAQYVLPDCDRLHVCWVHAMPHPAEVIDHEAVRDWPDQQLISESMSHHFAAGTPAKSPVAVSAAFAEPMPTTIGLIRDLPQEARCWIPGILSIRGAVPLPSPVMHTAPPALFYRFVAARDATRSHSAMVPHCVPSNNRMLQHPAVEV